MVAEAGDVEKASNGVSPEFSSLTTSEDYGALDENGDMSTIMASKKDRQRLKMKAANYQEME